MKTKSRHLVVEGLICKRCGKGFSARKQRVDAGLGIYCSRACASLSKAERTGKQYVGKENGKTAFDKTKNSYYVYWFEPETLKRTTTTYARWYWEVNNGEIPDGYKASYKDGNALNIDPDNIVLISPSELASAISERLMGHDLSLETRKKISVAHSGRGIRDDFSEQKKYPNFSKHLKLKVKERDGYVCKACGADLTNPFLSRVHHIDGDKTNPAMENLVLVCVKCHALIHSRKETFDEILAFRSMLHYD